MSETGLKPGQPPSPSDVPQPLSPAAQATLDLLLASGPSRPSPVSRLASIPVPQPDWPQAQRSQLASGPSVYDTGLAHPATRPSTAQPSPPSPSSRHNQQPGPAARQPATHGFAALGPAQSLPSPGPSASQGTQPLPAPNSQPTSRLSPVTRSGLSNVSETGLRPATSLTCLRLAQAMPAAQQPRLTRPFQRSLRLVSSPPAGVSYVSTGLRPSLASNSLPSLSPSSDPPKHSSAQPAEVPGATNTIIQLPSTTHGFAASWLRLASGPAQPATRLSQPHPSPSAYLAPRLGQPGLN